MKKLNRIMLLVLPVVCVAMVAYSDTDRRRGRTSGRLIVPVGIPGSESSAQPVKPPVQKPLPTTVRDVDLSKSGEQDPGLDVAYYINCVKRNGWLQGSGDRITPEQASHLWTYYKFSNKNKAGHWTRVESLDGYGKPVNGKMGTYLGSPNDDRDTGLDPLWKQRLASVVRWEMIGDDSGENCIREDAYDAKNALCYSFVAVPVGNNRYMGHFVDAWGMPTKLRSDGGASYVLITRNKDGYEESVEYLGDDGFSKTNSWGAYMAKNKIDNRGRVISNRSAAPDGENMYDRTTNSGQDMVPDRYGSSIVVYNYDPKGNKIRTKASNDQQGFVGSRYKTDKWGRSISMEYIDAEGRPDTTEMGINRIVYEYNDHGDCVSIRNYDLQGKLRANVSGWASTDYLYDKYGQCFMVEFRDSEGRYFNGPYGYSKVVTEFADSLGSWKDMWMYGDVNGDLLLPTRIFSRLERGYVDIHPKMNLVYIEKSDSLGENYVKAYYNLKGEPVIFENFGGHKEIGKIHTENGVRTLEKWIYDTNGHLMDINSDIHRRKFRNDAANHRLIVEDTVKRTMVYKFFDGDRLLKQYLHLRDSAMLFPEAEIGLDIMGEQAMTHLENALYERSFTGRTIDDGLEYIGITNEYGEIAYNCESDNYAPSVWAYSMITSKLDEYGSPIRNNSMAPFLPKVPKIEVFDSIANKYGIRSGDIIMGYGQWLEKSPKKTTDGLDRLTVETFLQRDNYKDMVVMRRNPTTNKAEYRVISLPPGAPADFGFFWHTKYCTEKERRRYHDVVNNQLPDFDFAPEKCDSVEVVFARPFRQLGEYKQAFSQGMKNNSIILGFKIWLNDSTTIDDSYLDTPGKNIYDLETGYLYCKDLKASRVWYTDDMVTVKTLESPDKDSYYQMELTTHRIPASLAEKYGWLRNLVRQEAADDNDIPVSAVIDYKVDSETITPAQLQRLMIVDPGTRPPSRKSIYVLFPELRKLIEE